MVSAKIRTKMTIQNLLNISSLKIQGQTINSKLNQLKNLDLWNK